MTTKGTKKQRQRVAKTLSKAFRKLEVGHQPAPKQQQLPQGSSSASALVVAPPVTKAARRRRQRQELQKTSLKKSNKKTASNSEQVEFDREQASLHARMKKTSQATKSKKNQSTRVIELQPPIFTMSPQEETIERGIAALGGIGGSSSSNYMSSNGMGEASSCFLLQQAQKKADEETATARHNRFAALLANDTNEAIDSTCSMQDDYCTPTPAIDTSDKSTLFNFPPPVLQMPRPRMTGMPPAPFMSSFDSLDL